jgi:TPR repeat protein
MTGGFARPIAGFCVLLLGMVSSRVAADEAGRAEKDCLQGKASRCVLAGTPYFKKDVGRAFKLYGIGCQANDHASCRSLTALGSATEAQDPATAADAYRRACAGGAPGGCSRLAKLQLHGKGIPRDAAGALASAKAGCRAASTAKTHEAIWAAWDACSLLQHMYLAGDGVPKDEIRATKLGVLTQAIVLESYELLYAEEDREAERLQKTLAEWGRERERAEARAEEARAERLAVAGALQQGLQQMAESLQHDARIFKVESVSRRAPRPVAAPSTPRANAGPATAAPSTLPAECRGTLTLPEGARCSYGCQCGYGQCVGGTCCTGHAGSSCGPSVPCCRGLVCEGDPGLQRCQHAGRQSASPAPSAAPAPKPVAKPPGNVQTWDDGPTAATKPRPEGGAQSGHAVGPPNKGGWVSIEGQGDGPDTSSARAPQPAPPAGQNTHGCRFVQSECLEVIGNRVGEKCGPNSKETTVRNRCSYAVDVRMCFAQRDGSLPHCGSKTVPPGGSMNDYACNTCSDGFGACAVPNDQASTCGSEMLTCGNQVQCR